MFRKVFNFTNQKVSYPNEVNVNKDTLYDKELGYGFFTEETRNQEEQFQLPELNTGFEPWHWLKNEKLTKIKQEDTGCYLDFSNGINHYIPLSFKCRIERQGNYKVTIGIIYDVGQSKESHSDLLIFTGRRRLMTKGITISSEGCYEQSFFANVCDIIPRGKTKPYKDRTLDITMIGENPRISYLIIEEIQIPTIFIAGDSTVTDQSAAYPYVPGVAYCGWASMLPCYINGGIGLSNHAHSGLTTQSFRDEGHYSIIEDNIKAGDYFFLQFGHNDQKLPHLNAYGGYMEEIIHYVVQIREMGAIPIIITPIARNTWRGSDGSYNDLLEEYAKACHLVGENYKIPVIDLHKAFMEKIKELGLEQAKLLFFPKDYTHTNDYGGYLAASFVAAGLQIANIKGLSEQINMDAGTFTPPKESEILVPPSHFKGDTQTALFDVHFKDIEQSAYKNEIISLGERGIISGEEENFRPGEAITRVEALAYIIKAVSFIPTNVYNDMYIDVLGHEWYAGVVECAYQNDLVDRNLISEEKFFPLKQVTWEEFCSFLVNTYKCRKEIAANDEQNRNFTSDNLSLSKASQWSKEYIKQGLQLEIMPNETLPQSVVSREEAAKYIHRLVEKV